MKKHKILLTMRWPAGGIRTFCHYVYNNFNPDKYSFTLMAPEIEGVRVLLDNLKIFNPSYIPIKNKTLYKDISFKLPIGPIISRKYDLVHSHGIGAGFYCALPCRIAGIPHIMTSHDIFREDQLQGWQGWFKKIAFSATLPMVNIIHHVSYDARNNMLDYIPILKRYPKKNIVIQNGVNTKQFSTSTPRDFRKDLDLTKDSFLIGFMGRFMEQKGFRHLVNALEILLKKNKLPKKPIIIAFGWGGFIREEQENIRKKGLQNYFFFLPFISNIASSLKALDVLTIPSLWEACPLLPMEAMIAGIPIIGTDCIGLREVLKDTPANKVPSKNSEALAEAILLEMKNPSKKKALTFQKEAECRFNVKEQAETIEQIILNLIK